MNHGVSQKQETKNASGDPNSHYVSCYISDVAHSSSSATKALQT